MPPRSAANQPRGDLAPVRAARDDVRTFNPHRDFSNDPSANELKRTDFMRNTGKHVQLEPVRVVVGGPLNPYAPGNDGARPRIERKRINVVGFRHPTPAGHLLAGQYGGPQPSGR